MWEELFAPHLIGRSSHLGMAGQLIADTLFRLLRPYQCGLGHRAERLADNSTHPTERTRVLRQDLAFRIASRYDRITPLFAQDRFSSAIPGSD